MDTKDQLSMADDAITELRAQLDTKRKLLKGRELETLKLYARIEELEAELTESHEAYTALEKMYIQHRDEAEVLRARVGELERRIAKAKNILTD